MRKAPALALLLAVSALSGCAWLNRALMYQPRADIDATPTQAGLPYTEAWLQAADGPRLQAWLIPEASTSPVVLLCHGNGGNISHRLLKAKLLRKAGASVLLFDYRGYGHSGGKPTEDGTYADGEAAYSWLRARGTPDSRIVFYGESLGAGVAVELATRHRVAGLVVDSGFTSSLDMGKRLFPRLPVSWLVRYRYDNLDKMKRVLTPVLVLHSPEDEIVPYSMGQALYEAAPDPKTFAQLQGSHNQGFVQAAQAYVDALRSFLGTPVPKERYAGRREGR